MAGWCEVIIRLEAPPTKLSSILETYVHVFWSTLGLSYTVPRKFSFYAFYAVYAYQQNQDLYNCLQLTYGWRTMSNFYNWRMRFALMHWVGIDMTEKTFHNEKQKRATCFEFVSKLSLLAGIKMPQQCIKRPKSHFGPTTASLLMNLLDVIKDTIVGWTEQHNVLHMRSISSG